MVEYKSPPRTTPCTPSELHPYIYNFLVEHGLPKTAKHLKKEAGKECCEKPSGDDLLEIFSKHMCAGVCAEPVYSAVPPPTLDETPAVPTETPAVPTEDTSKKSKKKKRKLEEAEVQTTQVTEVVESEEKPKKKKKKSKKDEVTPTEQPAVVEQPAAVVEETPKIAEPTEDESITNTTEETVEPVKTKKKKKKKSKSDISPPATTEEATTPQVTEETTPTVEEAVKETPAETEETKENSSSSENTASEDTSSEPKVPKTKKLKKNESFRRVIAEEVIVPDQLADNSFDAKIGARGDWGQKANEDLRFTKGKSFRHEKTKKKRGSYRGGNINVSVNSIPFSDDED